MDLNAFLARIENLHPVAIDLGLNRIRSVAEKFIPLSFECPVVTVAGTNGKGTTVAVLAALAQAAGWKVGTYTSPHLYRFNERIQINGLEITDHALLESLQAVEQARGETTLTYFEYTTLAALHYFHLNPPDLIILEVGLGGRLDATNMIDTDIAIITSIGLDHTAFLGDTKEKIAAEKAGIMRSGKPVICGEVALQSVLRSHAERVGALFDGLGQDFSLIDNLNTNAVPSNIACAVQAAQRLNIPVDHSVIEQVRVPGRKQHLRVSGKNILLDVAHNEDSVNELLRYLETLKSSGFHLVLGVMGDKSFGNALPLLAQRCKTVHLCRPPTPRAMNLETLAALLPVPTLPHASVEAAFNAALDSCLPDESVIVTGSFYTLSSLSF